MNKVLIVEDQFVEANDLKLMLQKEGYIVCGIARDVDTALDMISKERPGLVLIDIFLKGKKTGIDLAYKLKEEGIAFIYTSANSNAEVLDEAKKTEPYGFLVKPYREKDLLVTLQIARYRHDNSREAALKKKALLQKELDAIAADSDEQEKLFNAVRVLQLYFPFDFAYISCDSEEIELDSGLLRTGFKEYQVLSIQELKIMTQKDTDYLKGLKADTVFPQSLYYINDEFEDEQSKPRLVEFIAKKLNMRSYLCTPVIQGVSDNYRIVFFSRNVNVYSQVHKTAFDELKESLAGLFKNSKTGNVVESTINFNENFTGIIGRSPLLFKVFDHVMHVAAVDTSVLLLGESGTGKERIVDCIHKLSNRSDGPLIKINCAAIPKYLIESELFGHEKGSFTGAMESRTGKFELAHKGTLFLDEIGELPLEMQAKLLRVLQEKEIEKVGGYKPIKTDVRIIAATNRNLEKEVGEGRFRLDLYYRLNIFPISLPPLRERREDIPLLINHFIDIYNKKTGKSVVGVSNKALQQFMAYSWPGNIRELENLIERGVLLANDNVISETHIPVFSGQEESNASIVIKSIQENERSHIINVLKQCNGKVSGLGGAAYLLDVPSTTLNSKMKKLGITRNDYKN